MPGVEPYKLNTVSAFLIGLGRFGRNKIRQTMYFVLFSDYHNNAFFKFYASLCYEGDFGSSDGNIPK